jgi:hypothetical protein
VTWRGHVQDGIARAGSGDVAGKWSPLPSTAEQVRQVSSGDRLGKRPDRGLWREWRDAGSDAAVWVLERRFDEIGAGSGVSSSRGVFSYGVTDAGAIVLPDGVRIPRDGWIEYGVDFLNTDEQGRLVVLRGDSGWVGLVDNADALQPFLEDLYREAEPARYQAHVQDKALYLTRVGGGAQVWVGPLPKNLDENGICWQASRHSRQDCVSVAVIWRN